MSKKSQNPSPSIDEVIDGTFEKLKNILDANTVVGKVITLGNTHILPISKISVGIVTGGGNLPKKNNLSAGTGSGFNIIPIGFITISDGIANYLPVNNEVGVNKVLDGIFKMYEVLSSKQNSEGESEKED